MKYDVILWDNIGSPYSRSLVDAKAIGGSEYALVLLAEAFARKGLKVVGASNASRDHIASQNNVEYIAASRFDDFDPAINPVSTSVLIVSRFSSLPKNITYDRVFVLAQDQPWIDSNGACAYDHFEDVMTIFAGKFDFVGTLVCMSEWHANLFRKRYPAWNIIVIPAAIDNVHYFNAEHVGSGIKKNPNKFVYASAAVKGWGATKLEWIRLKRENDELLKNAELHVTSPGYDTFGIDANDEIMFDIHEHGPIPPRELSTFMADAAGLFFVNTYPESFCVVAAIAEIMGCRTHILVEPPGELDVFRSTLNSVMPTRDRRQFEEMFVHIFSGGLDYMPPAPKDFRMSTLIEAWMDAAFPVTPGFRRYIPDAETSAILEAGPTMIVGTAVSPDVYTKVPDEHFEALMGFNPSSPDDEKYTMSIRWSVDCGAKTIESASYPGPYQKRKPYASPTLTKLEGEALVIGEGSDYPMLENRGLGPDRKATPMKLYNPPTLGLVIIAKNERDVLPRALLSSKGIVDFYTVVLDQQNNDDSIEVIDATDGLPDGPVHRAPSAFSGHAAARNEALRLASVRHAATDFLLMLDADDSLNLVNGKKPVLDPQYDGYEVMIIDGTLKYRRLAITRPGVVTYKRRAHEYPETKAGAKIGFLPELVIIRGSGGDARKTPFKKFLKDIEWLEKDLREMPNDPRTVFYLAQSHWDAARACEDPVLQKTHYKRARALYVQRALQENTFGQERFISRMRAATLSELFGEKFYAKAHWLAALEEDPRRWPEPAVELVRMYNGDQKFAMALAIGMPNRLVDGKLDRKGIVFEPPDDGLFVDVEPYQWKLKLELSVTVFYLGNKRQSAFWTQELIDAPTTPEYVKTTLRSNLEFCK